MLFDWVIQGNTSYRQKLWLGKLAPTLDVSPMSTRETVRGPAREDVVTIRPRAYCRLKLSTRASMLEAFEMRAKLEIHPVKTVFGEVTSEKLSELRGRLEQMDGVHQDHRFIYPNLAENSAEAVAALRRHLVRGKRFPTLV